MNKPWQTSAAAISSNLNKLDAFRYRDISSYGRDDKTTVLQLFESFQEALKKSLDNRKSPVSVGKTLSLFAPGILPIGDSNIAHTYGCLYTYCGAEEYVVFMDRMKISAEHVKRCVPRIDEWPLLKRIDEYNYSKYTMHWL